PQPEPGVEELRVGRRHEDVVRRQALLEPAGRGLAPDVPQPLRIGRRVPGRVDPDVGPPPVFGPCSAEHVRAVREGSGRSLREQCSDLCAVVGVSGQLREHLPVPLVPLGQQLGCGVDVLVCKGDDRHGRTLAEMSPKTLTGAELDLSDAPARDAELFLVDGNNLAYRAFFALPEELATSEGFPTNALLGFTNMLFKLLSDYRPKGVAVAWDTRPVHRHAQAAAAEVVYKEGR